MPDPILTGHRNEAWRVDVLNLDGSLIGHLDGVSDGQYDFSIHNTIRSGGSITNTGQDDVDWHRVHLQPWYILKDSRDREVRSWPMGEFIPSAPTTVYSEAGKEVEVELYDKMLILDQDKVHETKSFAAGKTVTDAIREVILSTGQSKISIEESDQKLRNALFWEAGTSKLRIVNDLLSTINYFSVWVDGYGVFRCEHYKGPQSRNIAWEFVDNRDSIYTPNFTHDADAFNVPNRFVGISRSDGDEESLTAQATNEDPDSPFSYQSRGRWITNVATDIEAADSKTLLEIVERRLVSASQVTSSFEVEHQPIELDLNSAVLFRNELQGIDVRAVVQSTSVKMETGALMTSNFRQVV